MSVEFVDTNVLVYANDGAAELGCHVVWTEDLSGGQRYGPVTAQNPVRA